MRFQISAGSHAGGIDGVPIVPQPQAGELFPVQILRFARIVGEKNQADPPFAEGAERAADAADGAVSEIDGAVHIQQKAFDLA